MIRLHPDDYLILRRMTGLPFSVLPEGYPEPSRCKKCQGDDDVKRVRVTIAP